MPLESRFYEAFSKKDKAQLLLSIQSPKIQGLRMVGRSTGTGNLDLALSAALCSGMERRCYLTARLAWLGDWSVSNELERLLWQEAAFLSSREKWPSAKGVQYPRQLAGLAIAELADPKPWEKISGKLRWMWCSESAWHRYHRGRYEAVYQVLTDWLDTAAAYVVEKNKR